MKYAELHRKIKANGWSYVNAEGRHYFYEKNGVKSPPVPFHGAKEVGEGLRKKIFREMGLK